MPSVAVSRGTVRGWRLRLNALGERRPRREEARAVGHGWSRSGRLRQGCDRAHRPERSGRPRAGLFHVERASGPRDASTRGTPAFHVEPGVTGRWGIDARRVRNRARGNLCLCGQLKRPSSGWPAGGHGRGSIDRRPRGSPLARSGSRQGVGGRIRVLVACRTPATGPWTSLRIRRRRLRPSRRWGAGDADVRWPTPVTASADGGADDMVAASDPDCPRGHGGGPVVDHVETSPARPSGPAGRRHGQGGRALDHRRSRRSCVARTRS